MMMENIRKKIILEKELQYLIKRWRLKGDKIAFTNGCFDLLHSGHLKVLSEAKASCDRLIVGLNTDESIQILKGKNRPIKTEQERALCLASLCFVDAVYLFNEETPKNLIHSIRPDALIKGGDYNADQVIGADFVIENNGKLILVPLEQNKSSTNLIDKMRK